MTTDEQIYYIDANIRNNLRLIAAGNRGLLSQNILSQLRNLVEACMVRLERGNGSTTFHYDLVKDAENWVASRGKYRFLYDFHLRLQASDSHYTLSEDASERLMLRYLDYLYKVRVVAKEEFGVNILCTLEDFPVNQTLQAPYRQAIASLIEAKKAMASADIGSERYYVWRMTPFFVGGRSYYEVTLTPARDRLSNTEHIVAYTSHSIQGNHAIRVALSDDGILIDGFNIPVTIIHDWCVSIRPCELACMASILGLGTYKTGTRDAGYQALMKILLVHRSSMLDIARYAWPYYHEVKQELLSAGATKEVQLLDAIRVAVRPGLHGANIVSYLAYGMRHGVLKDQYDSQPNPKLSNLHLANGCIAFDDMPYCMNPKGHVAKISDVIACVDYKGHKHEMLAARLKANAEREGEIFTRASDLPFDNPEQLGAKYNSRLFVSHRASSMIESHNGHLYISSYVNDAIEIMAVISARASCGLPNYAQEVDSALASGSFGGGFADEKIDYLKRLFCSSTVVALYGSAGTGKSTFVSLVSRTTRGSKLFLAYTHAAVENLKRRVGDNAGEFETVESYVRSRGAAQYSLVVVDECSTVPNAQMARVLGKVQTQRLLLVGDECQIGSIRFGNWFEMCKRYLHKGAMFTLQNTFRTTDEDLLLLWTKTRNRDVKLDEFISKQNFVSRLGPEVFDRLSEDEVVLCLSYNGLYGVNNVNRILQQANQGTPVEWQHQIYKVGDPVVFGDTRRFLPVIHNNSKGVIRRIEKLPDKILFDVEVQSFFTAEGSAELQFLGNPSPETSLVRFYVFLGDDGDDSFAAGYSNRIVPFQISYAMSIHKAQGLEYDSVKLVIPCEVDDLVTHDIFYTGITRSKKYLHIYWEPESQAKILKSFDGRSKRANVLKKELVFLRQLASARGASSEKSAE